MSPREFNMRGLLPDRTAPLIVQVSRLAVARRGATLRPRCPRSRRQVLMPLFCWCPRRPVAGGEVVQLARSENPGTRLSRRSTERGPGGILSRPALGVECGGLEERRTEWIRRREPVHRPAGGTGPRRPLSSTSIGCRHARNRDPCCLQPSRPAFERAPRLRSNSGASVTAPVRCLIVAKVRTGIVLHSLDQVACAHADQRRRGDGAVARFSVRSISAWSFSQHQVGIRAAARPSESGPGAAGLFSFIMCMLMPVDHRAHAVAIRRIHVPDTYELLRMPSSTDELLADDDGPYCRATCSMRNRCGRNPRRSLAGGVVHHRAAIFFSARRSVVEESPVARSHALPRSMRSARSLGVYFRPQESPGFILQCLHHAGAVHLYRHVEPAAAAAASCSTRICLFSLSM